MLRRDTTEIAYLFFAYITEKILSNPLFHLSVNKISPSFFLNDIFSDRALQPKADTDLQPSKERTRVINIALYTGSSNTPRRIRYINHTEKVLNRSTLHCSRLQQACRT